MRKSDSRLRFKRAATKHAQLELKDEILSACRKLTILGNLLAAARSDIEGRLELPVVVQSGEMIAEEAERLRELLRTLYDAERIEQKATKRTKA